MNIILADTVHYYAKWVLPDEDKSCFDLANLIIGSINTGGADEEFQKRINLAKFVFDDVQYFRPSFGADTTEERLIYDNLRSAPEDIRESRHELVSYTERRMTGGHGDPELAQRIDEAIDRLLPPHDELQKSLVFTTDPIITNCQLNSIRSLNREPIIGLLATAGIDFVMPSIFIKEDEEIDKFKEKFDEERLDYLLFLNEKADEVGEMLRSQEIEPGEILDFARKTVAPDLELKAKRIEAAVAKEGKNAIQYMWNDFRKRVPTIGSSIMKMDFVGAGEEVLQSLAAGFGAREHVEAFTGKYPEAAYIYRVKSAGRE